MPYLLLIHGPVGQRASRDEALALASRCPAAEWATVEVRQTGPCYS